MRCINRRISKAKLLILALVFAAVVSVIACGPEDPDRLRVVVDGQKLRPSEVKKMDFNALSFLGMPVDQAGNVYVLGWPDDDIRRYHVYRLSPGRDWERLSDPVSALDDSTSMVLRPGTSELYVRRCGRSTNRDGRTVYGQVDFLRISPEGRVVDVTRDYLGVMSQEHLDNLEPVRCGGGNWAIEPDGSLLLANPDALWRIRDGNAEFVLDYLDVTPPNPELCDLKTPLVRMGPNGETLIYNLGHTTWPSRCRPTDDDHRFTEAFQLIDDKLEPVLTMDKDASIRDAAIGPDGAVYALTTNYSLETDKVHMYLREKDGSRVDFLQGIYRGLRTYIRTISFGPDGKMYLFYVRERGGPLTGAGADWMVEFRTDRVLVED